MLYIKSYAFIKRTCLLLSPLFLVTLASKELAFYSPAATLSPMLGDSDEAKDSIITLASHLHQDLPDGIEDYGNLKIQKNWFGDLWIEETNSLSTFSHNTDYKFKEAKDLIKKEADNRYVLKQKDFEEAVKDKGDINVLITFQLSTATLEPIQITHIVPLIDLTTATTKEYTVVSTKVEANDQKRDHTLRVQKDESKQEISFQLVSEIIQTSFWGGWGNAKLAINSFYFLFNDNPPLNPKAYFSTLGSLPDLVGDSSNGRVKKVFLNKWSNSNKQPKPEESTEPKYEFTTDNGFWTSTCSDPYRVGGFIDEDLAEKYKTKKTADAEAKKQIDTKEKTKLQRQKKSYVEFRANKKEVEERTGQYFWKQIRGVNAYVPHDEYTEKWKPNCQGLDPETKNKFEEHLNKVLERELKPRINAEIAPPALIKEVKNGNGRASEKSEYPYYKIVQSSFRAWGNTYLTKEGDNAKDEGKYSKPFELANQSEHTFSIKIKKATWTQFLTQKRLENLNKFQDISSLMEVYYPISFSFFDPISSHLRKHSLLLKTELDLSKLYEQSSYSKEVYRFDIGRNNSEIGKDYQGFSTNNRDKEKPYGLDGLLSFVSKLELDKSKDLNISLIAKVNGFVNTKNPSCDLRHRVYKIKNLNGDNWNISDSNLKCNTDSNWSYRKHIHIPSYLVLSLDREPEVSSFYIDRQSGVIEQSKEEEEEEGTSDDTSKPIETLSELSKKLDAKEIVKVVETNESNKAEVYFRDIETYGENKKDGFPHDTSSWLSSNQQLFYWNPKRAYGEISDVDFENLNLITLKLNGSKNSYSSFFHSNHFNTLTTLCLNDKYTISSSSSSDNKDCGDGNQYSKEEKDTNSSQLHDLWGAQELVINFVGNNWKNKEENAEEVKFRVTYNRANRKESSAGEDKDNFQEIKPKLEKFFKGEETVEPKSSEIPEVSMLAFWYSIFFWKDEKENKLHYATQIRPIGLITKQISNSTSHYAQGAAGSAGFEISKFEFRYTSSSGEATKA